MPAGQNDSDGAQRVTANHSMTAAADGACSHLSPALLEELAGPVWCVTCDGYVSPDGTVRPRRFVGAPPVKRGRRFARVIGKIPVQRR